MISEVFEKSSEICSYIIASEKINMNTLQATTTLLLILIPILSACAGLMPTPEPQDPNEYLENALNWIQTRAVFGRYMNWESVRREALALAPNPQKTADTYPAIRFVLSRLNDNNAFLSEPDATAPDDYIGMSFHGTGSIVLYVDPNGPADRAGVRVGDYVALAHDLHVPNQHQLVIMLSHAGEPGLIRVVLDRIARPKHPFQPQPAGRRISTESDRVGYVELPSNYGYPPTYPGWVHQLMRKLDRTPVCGWIFDLRRNDGGDIWSYLAALGPILDGGDVGGFIYPDGTHELWSYRDGKIFWADDERGGESIVEGGIYIPKRKMPPVALLISEYTNWSGELIIVALEGREKVRTFGEFTHGLPTLRLETHLSDGAAIYLSGAFATDRNSNIYQYSISPDENVSTDWSRFGTDQDPVILKARDWLNTQPECEK
jgi:C-terminal processing protease CtpA/Prc